MYAEVYGFVPLLTQQDLRELNCAKRVFLLPLRDFRRKQTKYLSTQKAFTPADLPSISHDPILLAFRCCHKRWPVGFYWR